MRKTGVRSSHAEANEQAVRRRVEVVAEEPLDEADHPPPRGRGQEGERPVEEDHVDLGRQPLREARLGVAHGLLEAVHRGGRRVLGLRARLEEERPVPVHVGLERVEEEAAAGHGDAAGHLVPDPGRPVDQHAAHAERAEQAEDRPVLLPHQEPVLDPAHTVHEGDPPGRGPAGGRTSSQTGRSTRVSTATGSPSLRELDGALVLRCPGIEPQRVSPVRHDARSLSRRPTPSGPLGALLEWIGCASDRQERERQPCVSG